MHQILAKVVPTLALSVACVAPLPAGAADALPRLHADPSKTSVSGLSSGGFMAIQYGVAFSASVKGVGVVAGGPYNCANAEFGALALCMTGNPTGAQAWAAAKSFEAFGQIDPVTGIAKQRVYLFSGKKDTIVVSSVVDATRDFYHAAGVPAGALAYVKQVPSGHAFVSPTFGKACGFNGDPYVERCIVKGNAYDQPKELLGHIYGPLHAAASSLSATVQPFDQRDFASEATSLDSIGFVYIPRACAGSGNGCAVHVVLHGCLQGYRSVGSDVYGLVGFNRWADTNRIIILYPQVMSSAGFPYNPNGCWDWWGQLGGLVYTGPTFMVRSGVQLSAIKAMVDRLTGK